MWSKADKLFISPLFSDTHTQPNSTVQPSAMHGSFTLQASGIDPDLVRVEKKVGRGAFQLDLGHLGSKNRLTWPLLPAQPSPLILRSHSVTLVSFGFSYLEVELKLVFQSAQIGYLVLGEQNYDCILCLSFVREYSLFVNKINCSLFTNKKVTNNCSSNSTILVPNCQIISEKSTYLPAR